MGAPYHIKKFPLFHSQSSFPLIGVPSQVNMWHSYLEQLSLFSITI